MENDLFSTTGSIDLNTISLQLTPTVQSPDIEPKHVSSQYLTSMQKHINDNDTFYGILQDTHPIDFTLIAEGEKTRKLRTELLLATNDKIKATLQAQIEKLYPKPKKIIVISCREFLEACEKKGFGIACVNEEFNFYNGKHWFKVDKEVIIAFLGEFAERLGIDPLEAKSFETREMFYKQLFIEAAAPDFNKPNKEILIPFQNGTVYFKDGKPILKPHNKNDHLKYLLPFDYEPKSGAEMFRKYFNVVLPDEDLQKIIFEFFGSAFARMDHDKTLFLLGRGANGKSVLFKVIRAAFGKENVTSVSVEDLCGFQSQSLALIEHKLLNFCPDIGSRKFDIGIFKKIVSQEPLIVKEVYKKPYTMENYGRLVFNCNSLPREAENSDAYHRRLLIIPFDVQIPESQRDYNLSDKIIASELPGIFNLIIEGLGRLLSQGNFTQSDIVDEQSRKYRNESNTILSFIEEEMYVPSSDYQMPIRTFYELYKEYCTQNGSPYFSDKNFKTQLRNAGFKIDRGTNGFYCIRCERLIPGVDEDIAKVLRINDAKKIGI